MISLVALLGYEASGAAIRVVEADPLPNYGLTVDGEDLAQLTDGVLSSYPIWSTRQSVGWQDKPIVTLIVALASGSPDLGLRGIRLVTAKGVYAGVYPPSLIDVYCGSDAAGWVLHSSRHDEQEQFPDRRATSIDISFSQPCLESLAIVLHANGAFLMLDEVIALGEGAKATVSPEAPSRLPRKMLARDSARRHRDVLLERQEVARQRIVNMKSGAPSAAWLSDPGSAMSLQSMTAETLELSAISVVVAEGQRADYMVGVLNPGPEAQVFRLSWPNDPDEPRSFFSIHEVLAGNGETVFDPIRPEASPALHVPPRQLRYMLVRQKVTADHRAVVVVEGDRSPLRHHLTVDIRVVRSPAMKGARPPSVITWSYPNDVPIWRTSNQDALVRELASFGVNAFVIPPWALPSPWGQSAPEDGMRRLEPLLDLYRDAQQVLLFTDWKQRFRSKPITPNDREAIADWLKHIVVVMERHGFPVERWALYPLDEPRGEDYTVLGEVVAIAKAMNPPVRVYANPGKIAPNDRATHVGIRSVSQGIDIWQPHISEVPAFQRIVGPMRADQEMWIYQVVRRPAKAVAPNCWRKLGWEAVRLGATGLGFWSFSDTGRSSAWDDYDGRRPDWAVVYEADDAPFVSSLRWEAFGQGVRDFVALRSCGEGRAGRGLTDGPCEELWRQRSSEFQALQCL